MIVNFLLFVLWTTESVAGFSFKPYQRNIQVELGNKAVFVWKYDLANSETVTFIKLGFVYYKDGEKKYAIVASYSGKAVEVNPKFVWYKEHATFKVNITARETRMSIPVQDLENDNRIYFCDIFSPTLQSAHTKLKVIYAPMFRLMSDSPKIVRDKDSTTLICNVDAKPGANIQWLKNGFIVSQARNSTTHSLVLNSVSRTSSGNYTCFASNIVGNISYHVVLIVQYAPVINQQLSSHRIVSYLDNPKPVYIKCVADGVPKPTYKWNGPVHQNEIGMNSSYVLTFPRYTDFGLYRCEASNDLGAASHEVKVVRLSKPGKVGINNLDYNARSVRFTTKLPTDLGNGVLKELILSYRFFVGNEVRKVVLNWNKTYHIHNGLTPYSHYVMNVTVKNEIFEGVGQKIEFETLTDAPGPPVVPDLTALSSAVMNVSWQQPIEPNGVIMNYSVKFFEKEAETFEDALSIPKPSTTFAVFENLKPYTLYVAAVKAATSAGYGEWSLLAEKRTDPIAPATPENISVIVVNFQTIKVYWKAPQSSQVPITKYELQYHCVSKEDSSETKPKITPGTSGGRYVQINSMLSYSDCELILREGAGEKPTWSNYSQVTEFVMPEGAPDVVTEFETIRYSYNKVYLRWKRPLKIHGNLQKFTIIYKNITDRYESEVTDQLNNMTFYHTLDFLKPDSIYEINVYAHSKGAVSKPSQTVTVTTQKFTGLAGPNTDSNGGSNTGAILGGVFTVLFVIILVVIVFLYISRRKRLKNATSDSSGAGFVKLAVTESSTVIVEIAKPSLQSCDNSSKFRAIRPIPITTLRDYVNKNHGSKDKGFIDEFRSIKPVGDFTYEVSNRPENKCKNRYANILAYDHTRVVLNTVENLDGSDYVNANYIDGFKKKAKFIASQGPVVAAFDDFWRMVWEQNTHTIVMVTNLVERSRIKCQKYWPSEIGMVQVQSSIHIKALDEIELADYVIRTFKVSLVRSDGTEQASRKVTQYQFLSWPDHGVPQYATGLLQFVKRIRSLSHENVGPILIHCSAGVGRTGTFIALDAMLDQMEDEKVVDILGFVTHMRNQRSLMVQTEPQYIFVYDALLESVACGNTEVFTNDIPTRIKHLCSINPGTTRTYMQEEFERLSMNIDDKSQYEAAMLPYNKPKNRFQQVLPYESARIKLWPYPNVEGSDYINASFVDGYQQREAYMLTQAPLENTIHDFWRMLWEYEVFSIVMISSPTERDMHHCYPYWPVNNEPTLFGLLRVQIAAEEERNGYIRREFRVTNSKNGESRVISHFMYFDWPTDGAPSESTAIIEMIGQLQKSQQQTGNNAIVIHCSDGSGRSGALTALMYCLEKVKLEGVIDVFQTVRSMRTQRTSLVQHLDQYQFIYTSIRKFLDCFSNYANFK